LLDQDEAASLLEQTLEEEKETDAKLTELAEDINVAAEEGSEEFVRVIMPIHRTGFSGEHLVLVPHDVGEAQSAETTPAKSHDVVDIAKVDLTQLQSDPQVRKRK